MNQFAAIVKRNYFDVWRQDAAIQFLGLSLNSLKDILCLPSPENEDNALDGVIIFLKSELTEPGRMPDGDVANIANPYGDAFVAAGTTPSTSTEARN